jgi:hypothetical protein
MPCFPGRIGGARVRCGHSYAVGPVCGYFDGEGREDGVKEVSIEAWAVTPSICGGVDEDGAGYWWC